MQAAEQRCAARGASLTALRGQVLRLVLEAGQPIGAYALLEKLKGARGPAAPPTVHPARRQPQPPPLERKRTKRKKAPAAAVLIELLDRPRATAGRPWAPATPQLRPSVPSAQWKRRCDRLALGPIWARLDGACWANELTFAGKV